jgi:FtsP/CotA-like multicopper oxidase with cupredoxin domain
MIERFSNLDSVTKKGRQGKRTVRNLTYFSQKSNAETSPSELNEQGWKDTLCANPWEITRIIVPFGPYTGLFVWHFHILEHEDYEVMGPYVVIR